MSGCEEVREILVAVARGVAVSAPGQKFLHEHVESCGACRRRLANERMLSAGLGLLTAQAGSPPPHIKTALLSEFRKQQTVRPIRPSLVKWGAVAGLAAAILLAVLVASERHPQAQVIPPVKTPVAVVSPAPPAVTPPAAAPMLAAETRLPKARPARTHRVPKVATPPVENQPEVATDFFEIPYAQPLRPEERADVFRMQMPRASMAVYGLPVSGGRLDSRITADVLMGEDGVARAIRFIR
jgi:hypothetical protein